MHFKQPVKHTPPLPSQHHTGNNRWDFSTIFRLMTSPCCPPCGGGGALVVAGIAKGCHSHLAYYLIRQLSCQREACAPAGAAADTRRHHPEKVAGFPHKLLSIKGRDLRRHNVTAGTKCDISTCFVTPRNYFDARILIWEWDCFKFRRPKNSIYSKCCFFRN